MLAIAKITVADRHGDPHPVRVLIDQGSEVFLISEALVQRLRLPRSRATISIFGIGGSPSSSCRGKISLSLTSRINGARVTAAAFILPVFRCIKAQLRHAILHGLTLKVSSWLIRNSRPPIPSNCYSARKCSSIILQEGLRKGDSHLPSFSVLCSDGFCREAATRIS